MDIQLNQYLQMSTENEYDGKDFLQSHFIALETGDRVYFCANSHVRAWILVPVNCIFSSLNQFLTVAPAAATVELIHSQNDLHAVYGIYALNKAGLAFCWTLCIILYFLFWAS